jgi:DNA ligase (NAD+)
VVGIEKSRRAADSRPFEYISECPECHTELIRIEGEAKHYCPNETGCPPQIKGKLIHFVSRRAMDIGLAEATVTQLYDLGMLHTVADFYKLTREQLLDLERFAEKSAQNLVDSIQQSKRVPFPRVLYALGIRYVGETVAKTLALHFKSIQRLRSASLEELVAVNEIGERIAQSIIDFFADAKNQQVIRELEEAGVQMELKEKASVGNALEGKSIVVSGVFANFSRDEIKALIEQHGGRNVSSISAKTDFVVAGENMGPSKLAKARELNIPIISESDLMDMINKV